MRGPQAVLSHLSLRNFRNYSELDLELGPGIFLLWGPNGAGKTNLVEAVYLLGNRRSWRRGGAAALCRRGTTEAVVAGEVFYLSDEGKGIDARSGDHRVVARISARTEMYLDGRRGRIKEITRHFPVVAFAPDDLDLTKGSGEFRRDYLDHLGSRVITGYSAAKTAFDRALRQRAAVLKAAAAKGRGDMSGYESGRSALNAWNDEFAQQAAGLLVQRLKLYEMVRPALEEALVDLDAGGKPEVAYLARMERPIVADLWEAARSGDTKAIAEEYRDAIAGRLRDEISRGTVLVGPQRDDIEVRIDGHSTRDGVSQGQQRLVAVALRIAEARVLEIQTGRRPVMIMDDVFSELDDSRRERIWEILDSGQAFITSTSDETGRLTGRRGRVFSLPIHRLAETGSSAKTVRAKTSFQTHSPSQGDLSDGAPT